ncbi:MAG: hypothetical protein GY832_09655 [Chloroflexi bacterium]|nr:hypothetical protein [Chloroflexota bacterium]
MYDAMLADVQRIVARSIYRPSQPAPPRPQRQQRRKQQSTKAQPTVSRGTSKQLPGRNDPCWCGSELKYKNCHMRLDSEKRRGATGATRPPQTSSRGKKSRRKKR